MASIKNTTNALGNLINQINGSSSAGTSAPPFSGGFGGTSGSSFGGSGIGIDDDSIPANMLNPEPIFEMNYKSVRKQCIKKAKEQIQIIVKEIVPAMMQDAAVISDKINQDADTLGSLYYEYEQNEKMIQSVMEIVSRGETSPRIFDVYAKLSDTQHKLIIKITETQNQMRKYYIDTYLDIQQKDKMDDNFGISSGKEQKAIEADKPEETANMKNIVVGTNQTVAMLNEKKKQALIAQYEEIEKSKNEN